MTGQVAPMLDHGARRLRRPGADGPRRGGLSGASPLPPAAMADPPFRPRSSRSASPVGPALGAAPSEAGRDADGPRRSGAGPGRVDRTAGGVGLGLADEDHDRSVGVAPGIVEV